MATDANTPQAEPQLPDLPRRVARGICLFATFFSAFSAAHGVVMTVQVLNDHIPAGKVEAIVGHTKSGLKVRLDNGNEVVFSSLAIHRQPTPIALTVGDHVEKRRNSPVYTLNGVAITNQAWLMREFLLPLNLLIPLIVYLLVGSAYVLKYQRAPLGDQPAPDANAKPPRRPRTRVRSMALLYIHWLLAFAAALAFFGCTGGCLRALGKTLFQ